MANVKISELPQTTRLQSTDLVASVSGSTTTKITVKNLADSLTQVSSSILAATASYVNDLRQTVIVSGSIAQGESVVASGLYSNAQGNFAIASGTASYAQGGQVFAVGDYSHTEGEQTTANGPGSHAEGLNTPTNGLYSHTEGVSTRTTADYGHAEGQSTLVSGTAAHAEGYFTTASGNYSHAEGFGTVTNAAYQHVQGTYNISSSNPGAFIIGNGTAANNRKNLVYASGSAVEISGSLIVSGSTNSIVANNGYVVLKQVSSSLNYIDDTAAAAGGVPLGGLYRNGNFIVIRIS